ncbi:protein PF3D7_1417600 isoform X1 [Hydra vulgaris]|uniref:protein PF3D7_1417600 isoform X1 n=1 Tax=Hydra vulgaris TaxID=6087 RepID=UPI001F5F87BC|nr:protein PF3D7_1417600 [Hydra vulgaris]
MEKLDHLIVKAHYGNVVKRFSISFLFTYVKLICMLKELLEIDFITNLKFMDEENDLITVSTEEEFKEALKTVSKTDGILKLFVNDNQPQVHNKKDANQDKTIKECNFDLKLNFDSKGLQHMQSSKNEFVENAYNHISFADNKKRSSSSKKNEQKKKHKSSSDDSSRSSSSPSSSSSDESSYSSAQHLSVKKCLKSFKKEINNEFEKKLQNLEDKINAVSKKLEVVIHSVPGSNVLNLSQSKKNSRGRYLHTNVTCDNCTVEIFGPRYKCGNCSDYDLCEECESIEGIHSPSHVFLKIHYPSSHSGRKFGLMSRPLLQTNIYEEREKEREKEDLLQRKLSSGSEVNVKAFEEIDNLKLKINDADVLREIYEKQLKKEVKKRKKTLAKKIRQQAKFAYKSCDLTKNELLSEQKLKKKDLKDVSLVSSGFCFTPLKSESSIDKVYTNQSNVFDGAPSFESVKNSLDRAESTQSDSEIVVVKTGANFQMSNSGLMSKPDLVGCTNECLDSLNKYSSEYSMSNSEYPNDYSMTDDFIVVSKFFDLNVPIDGYQYSSAVNPALNPIFPKEKKVFQNEDKTEERLEYPDLGQSKSFQQTLRNPPSSEKPDNASNINLNIDLVSNINPSVDLVSNINASVDLVSNINLNTCNAPPSISDVTLPAQIVDNPMEDSNPTDQAPVDLVANVPLISSQPPDITIPGSSLSTEKYFETSPICHNAVTSQPDNSQSLTAIVTQPSVDCRRKINQSPVEKDSIRLLDQACAFNESNKLLLDSDLSVSKDNKSTYEMNFTHGSNPISKTGFSATNVVFPDSEHSVKYSSSFQNAVIARGLPNQIKYPTESNEMQQLLNMGFFDRKLNQTFLTKHANNVGACIDELLKYNDNNWNNLRH